MTVHRSRHPDPHHASIAGTGIRFQVEPRQTLLIAAQQAGVPWPNGCRVGLCGTCRCRVTRGQIKPLADFATVLDRDELERGYVLACRSLIDSDVELSDEHLRAAAHAARELPATITRLSRATPTVTTLELELEEPIAGGWLAGQYARLSVPEVVPPRCFSFASACRGDTRLLFQIRLFPGGRLGEWLTATDRTGAPMQVSPPLGELYLRDSTRPLLLFAGGTGLAPVMAMLEELVANPACIRPTRLIYAARDQAHLYDQERLAAIRAQWPAHSSFEFLPVLSREPLTSDWDGRRGYVFEYLDELIAGFSTAEPYLCGPPGLVDALELYLVKRGFARRDIHADRFLPAFS